MIEAHTFSDAEIIAQILDGQKILYEIIVRKYNPYLYKIGRSYNFNHQDTEDLMQDTFIDAYKNLGQFQQRSQFKTWLIKSMLNNCFRRKNKTGFKNEIHIGNEIKDKDKPMFTNHINNIENIVHNRELKYIIEDALSKISFDYRMVFTLREITGLSVAETSELLNISESNVKVRLKRARTILRNEIEKKYSADELFEFNLIYCDKIVKNVMNKILNSEE